MRFLHLSTFYPPYSFGGDAVYLQRLCHALGDAGHDVDVVHCVDAYHLLHPDDPDQAVMDHPKVRRTELRSGRGWLSPLLTQQTGGTVLKKRSIQRILNAEAYDVIHFHNISLLGPEILGMRTKNPHAIKVYTTHEHWLVCPMHTLWRYSREVCSSDTCIRCMLRAKRPPQWWRYTEYLKNSARHVDQFIAPSEFTAKKHAERGFDESFEVLPLFVELDKGEQSAPRESVRKRPYFLFVGRLEKLKGLQTLIVYWDEVKDADLLIAGSGTDEGALRALASGNPSIKFLGFVAPPDLGRLYARAEATIVPSTTYETFGLVAVESLARKTPVVVHDLGALPEIVRQCDGGFIYRTREEFLRAIKEILGNPQLRVRLGENGYRGVLERWSPTAHLQGYFAMLRRVAERKFANVPWEVSE